MRIPWVAGRVLTPDEFQSYCKRAMKVWRRGGIRLEDYQGDLLDFPLLMKPGALPPLARLTENLTHEILAAERELLSRPDLFRLLGLPPSIEKILQRCRPDSLTDGLPRVARFDFYLTTEGWKFSEANPDTVSGLVEAYEYTEPLARYYPGFSPPPNPAAVYAQAIRKAVGKDALVAVVLADTHPYSARQAHFLMKQIEMTGERVIRVASANLKWESGIARFARLPLTATPRLIVRQFTLEQLINRRRPSVWAPWFCGAQTPVSNPGYCILIESKRFPCVLKELGTPMSAFRSHSPESRHPDEVPVVSQNQWVFKPAFGGMGRGIVVAGVTKKSAFKAVAEKARRHPMKWVAQRRFESVALPTERGLGHVCLGIYTVDGAFAGVYARIRGKPLIDKSALSIPVLIPEGDLPATRH